MHPNVRLTIFVLLSPPGKYNRVGNNSPQTGSDMPYGYLIAATVMTFGICQGHSSIGSVFLYWQARRVVHLQQQSFLVKLYTLQYISLFLRDYYHSENKKTVLTIPRSRFPPPVLWIWCKYWTTHLIKSVFVWHPLSSASRKSILSTDIHKYINSHYKISTVLFLARFLIWEKRRSSVK